MNNTNFFKTSQFLSNIYVQTNLYTNLVYTKHIDKAMHLAEIMYLDLSDNSLIKSFISETINKQISVTGFINSKGKLESNNKSVFNTDLNSFRPSASKSAGVYLFTHTPSDKQYIGSAMNFQNRMQVHFSDIRHPSTIFHKFVSDYTWNKFTYGPIYKTTNYLTEFKTRYPKYVLTLGEIIILSHLTQLETRVLEQSLIKRFSPELNTTDVFFSYTSWNVSTLNQTYNPKNPNAVLVEVWLKEPREILTTFSSKLKAAEGLGVTSGLITRYFNKPYSFKSKLLELDVLVKSFNGVIDNTPIIHPKSKEYPLINYDIDSLEPGYIYVLDSDKSNIELRFNNTKSVIEHFYPHKFKTNSGDTYGRYVSIYYNKEKLVHTELGDFYFVCNPKTLAKRKSKGQPKVLWVINLDTGLALKFNSMLDASLYLDIKYIDSISKHLDLFTIYKKRYQFLSNDKFLELFPNATDEKYQLNLDKLPLKL